MVVPPKRLVDIGRSKMKDLSLALVIPAVAVKTQFLTYIAPAVASVPDILRTAGTFFLDLLRKSLVVFLTGKHRHLTFTENRHHSGIDVFHSRIAFDKKGILAVTGCIGIVRKLFSHFTLKNTVFSDVSTNEMY